MFPASDCRPRPSGPDRLLNMVPWFSRFPLCAKHAPPGVVAELVKRNLVQNGIPEVRMKVEAKRAQAEFTLRNSRVTFRVGGSTAL